MLSAVRQRLQNTKLSVHVIPGVATIRKDIDKAIDIGVDLFRIGCHCTEADVTQRHIARMLAQQKQVSLVTMAGMILALLAARSNPQAAMQAIQQLASSQRLAQRKLDTKIEQLRRKRDAEVESVERKLESTIRREQDWQKWLAVIVPPIPPLIVAFFVFFRRRALEREGVAKSRLR
jgi:hypothetical protein